MTTFVLTLYTINKVYLTIKEVRNVRFGKDGKCRVEFTVKESLQKGLP